MIKRETETTEMWEKEKRKRDKKMHLTEVEAEYAYGKTTTTATTTDDLNKDGTARKIKQIKHDLDLCLLQLGRRNKKMLDNTGMVNEAGGTRRRDAGVSGRTVTTTQIHLILQTCVYLLHREQRKDNVNKYKITNQNFKTNYAAGGRLYHV